MLLPVMAALALGAAPADAQSAGDTTLAYQREVFRYPRAGRPDPFRSLLKTAEFAARFEDLALRGIVYHADPRRSVAVLSQVGNERRVRVRVGDRLGGVRVTAIHPQRVDVVVEEFGVARRETLELRPAAQKGSSS